MKNSKFLKRLTSVATAAVVACGIAGCDSKDKGKTAEGNGEIPKSVTIFAPMSGGAAKAGAKNRNEIQVYKIAEEATGCHIEWTNPTWAAAKEQFNLMIASGEYPDLIQTTWNNVPGGSAKYVDDDVIVKISDYEKYMPNFKKYIDANPELKAQFANEDGSYEYIPCFRADEELRVYLGPIIRQDWLDKLGLKMPETTDELYEVLKAFKTKDPNGNGKADEIPFGGRGGDNNSYGIGNITSAFGVYHSYYIKNGKITYGMAEPEMKEALAYLRKLYSEGLIDADYLTQDEDSFHSKIMNDRTGFAFGIQPSRYYATMNDGTRQIAGVPWIGGISHNPAYKEGIAGGQIAITTSCKNPVGVAKWLDYFFSEDGITAENFGIEGENYEVVDGKKTYISDFFEKNPSGKDRSDMFNTTVNIYNTDFPGLQLWDAYGQSLTSWGKSAIETWSKSANFENALPCMKFTAEEQEVISKKGADVVAYASELFNGIIIGNRQLSELDSMKKELNKLGLKDVLDAYNSAYKRYLKVTK